MTTTTTTTTRQISLFSCLLLLLVKAPGINSETLLWSDEFNSNSLPDSTFWSYDLGAGGWGNQELQTYTDLLENVLVDNGSLEITARRTPFGFTSGRIHTQGKVSVMYGTIEASIKVPDLNEGLWPAFWTLGSVFGPTPWPDAGEIDIMEMGQGLAIEQGVVNRRVVSGAHWENEGQLAAYALSEDLPSDLNTAYHTYRLEWTPSRLATFVDGVMVWEMDISKESCTDCEEFHRTHFLLLNLAVGGGFTTTGESSSSSSGGSSSSSSSSSGCGSSSSATESSSGCGARTDVTAPLPATMLVDWVRIYDNGDTVVDLPWDSEDATLPAEDAPANIFVPPPPGPTNAPVAETIKAPPLTSEPEFDSPVSSTTTSKGGKGKAGGKAGGKGGKSSKSSSSKGGKGGKGKGGSSKSGSAPADVRSQEQSLLRAEQLAPQESSANTNSSWKLAVAVSVLLASLVTIR